MALDPAIADQLSTLTLTNAQATAQTGNTIGQNLSQGLGVVQTLVTQAQASNSDDPAVIAALQAANRVPGGDQSQSKAGV